MGKAKADWSTSTTVPTANPATSRARIGGLSGPVRSSANRGSGSPARSRITNRRPSRGAAARLGAMLTSKRRPGGLAAPAAWTARAESQTAKRRAGPLTFRQVGIGVRQQSEASRRIGIWAARHVQERQTLPEPKRCRAPLATALQSGLPETARQTLSLALKRLAGRLFIKSPAGKEPPRTGPGPPGPWWPAGWRRRQGKAKRGESSATAWQTAVRESAPGSRRSGRPR